jgi:hypothetical protein
MASSTAAQQFNIRDSAGITIVENSPTSAGVPSPFRVADRPTIQIGVEQGDRNYQFSEIVAATRLSNGSIVIADRGSSEIRVFDRAGRFVRKVGRAGQGPGEFRALGDVRALEGDSLIAWDAMGGRFTIFTPTGEVARTFTPSGGPANQPAPFGLIRGALSNGSFFYFGIARAPVPTVEAVTRDTHVVALYTRDGSYARPVGRFPALERLLHMGGMMPGPTGVMTPAWSVKGVPFPRETLFRTGIDGLYTGDGTTFEILRFDQNGFLKRIVRLRHVPLQVTPAIIAQQRREPSGRGTPSRPGVDSGLDASRYPKTLPAYSAFRVDGAHRLWVQDYPLPGDSTRRWNVFDREGRFAGVVSTPPRMHVLEIGLNWLLGVWRDDSDVEYLRLYDLSPAS